jgi:hypothetical protein
MLSMSVCVQWDTRDCTSSPPPSDAPSDMEGLELSEHDTTPGAARTFILYYTCVCVCERERERDG